MKTLNEFYDDTEKDLVIEESELDREIRTLQLQKQRKDGLIDFFAIHIFFRPKKWDNPKNR